MTDAELIALGCIDAGEFGCLEESQRIEARPGVERFDGPSKSVLLVRAGDDFPITWVLLEWLGGDSDDSDDGRRYAITACGSGPGGSLREPRHTWFGDEGGYVFYVKPAVLTWAFKALERWFDFD